LNNVEILTTANTTSYRTTYLVQDELTSLQNVDHTYTWDWTTTGTTNNHITINTEFVDDTSSVLQSYSSLSRSGSVMVPQSVMEDTYGIRVYLKNTGSTTNTAVIVKEISLTSLAEFSDLTSKKKYLYAYADPANRFGVAFQNSLGTFSTFDFVGLEEDTIDRNTKSIQYPVQPNTDGSLPAGFIKNGVYDVQTTKRVVVNSGLISQETFDWLIDLTKSNYIYSYTTDYLNYLILDGTPKYTKNNQTNEYNIECTFIQTAFENGVGV